jgi:hypothetical protein
MPRYEEFDIIRLSEADRKMYNLVVSIGGHTPYMRKGCVTLIRPGSAAGSSVSIGYIGPGIANFFTVAWKLSDGRMLPAGIYNYDELTSYLNGKGGE